MVFSIVQLLEKLPSDLHNNLPVVLLVCFLILLYKWLHPAKKKNANASPPCPRKLPIIGNLHQLGTLPHRSLGSLSKQYGDVMLLQLGNKPTLVISSAVAAEQIMKTCDTVFANRPKSHAGYTIMYNGIEIAFSKYGEYWRKIKSICVMHMLSNKKVQSFRNIRQEEVAVMIQHIKESSSSTAGGVYTYTTAMPSMAVNLSDMFLNYANDVLSRAAFGRKYDGKERCENLRELMDDFAQSLGAFSMSDFVPMLSWIDHISGVLRKATRTAKEFDILIEKIVREHMERANNNAENLNGNGNGKVSEEEKDLVDVLLEVQRKDTSIGRDIVKALLLDMFLGGVDTVSTVLQWSMSELVLNPRVMKKVQEEVRESMMMKEGKREIEEEDLHKMKYLKVVIKETLRLHPPLPFLLHRESSQDVKVLNYDIAAGTHVLVNVWAIQRNPAYWDDPEEFRPERFLNSHLEFKGLDFEYVPFGAGRRGCPGISFGAVKAELALANLVAHFDWSLPADVHPHSFMVERFGITVHRRHPLMLVPTPYSCF